MSAPTTTAGAIGRHVQEQADRYFPELAAADVQVRLIRDDQRPASHVYVYEVTTRTRRDDPRGVVAKVPSVRSAGSLTDGCGDELQPRLTPLTDARTKQRLEHLAMSMVQAHLERIGDPRLAAVRVLEHLSEHDALLLESVPRPTLRDRTQRLALRPDRRALAELEVAYANAGRWLRAFQKMPVPAHAQPRRPAGAQVAAQLAGYVRYLCVTGATTPVLRRVRRVAERCEEGFFPARYPLVWSHGDFAPRNLFVHPDGRVAGFDVLGRWATPTYEDLAYFLTAMSCSRIQLLTQGAALRRPWRGALRRAFLEGFGATPPVSLPSLRAYELLLLLDRWSRLRSRTPRWAGGSVGDRGGLVDRFCGRLVGEVLAEMGEAR